MKVLFLQNQPFLYFGVISIAGFLKSKEIETDVLIHTLEKNNDIFISKIKSIRPDMLGISAMSTEHSWINQIVNAIRGAGIETPIMVGGVHATIYGSEIIKNKNIDFVCVGEGENTVYDVLVNLHNRGALLNISGLLINYNNNIYSNTVKTQVDIDNIIEDRAIYYKRYPDLANDELKQFVVSRGCPFNCNFCYNSQIQTSQHMRYKNISNVLKELEYVKNNYGAKSIFFADDLFTANRKWIAEFLPLYVERIGVPFMCTTRLDIITEEIATLLKESGCHTVSVGIETGSERIRKEILNKNLSDDKIIKGAKILKEVGIRIQTSNMFCIPTETVEDALETIRLNIKIKADFVFVAILMPFPDTKIASIAQELGILKKDFSFEDLPKSFFTPKSIMGLPNVHVLENIYKVAYVCVRYPFLFSLFSNLVKFKFLDKVFLLIFYISLFYRYKSERNLSFFSTLKWFYRFRKSY